LRQSKILGDKKTREDCQGKRFRLCLLHVLLATSPPFKFVPCFWRQTEAFFWNADFYRANMQVGTKRSLRFLEIWLINTLAVVVAVIILRGHIRYGKPTDLIIASLLLGILNAFVRPILMRLALPLVIFTLGLFTLVINALVLYFVGVLMGTHFQVDSFGFAFLGAIIISIVSIALNVVTGMGNARVTFQRRPPPPSKSDDDGPVIDV
jgi:putative membrane protein